MNAPAASVPARVAPATADFPDWLPAMLVKELRQSLRAKGFVGLFLLFHLVAVLVFWWTLEINVASGLRETFNWLNGVFWGLLNVVLLLVVPLRGLGGLRTEIDNRTLDLLVLTRLTAWRIVLGKWVALVAQAALFLVAIMPYGVVRYFFGAVDLTGDLRQAGWMFLLSAALSGVALWVSGLPKLFRVILPILLFFSLQSYGIVSVMAMMFGGRAGPGGGPGLPFVSWGWSGLAGLALVTLVFLGLAVRRIAPPAENHALSARLLALALLLISGVAGLVVGPFGGSWAMAFGLEAIALVAAVEMAHDVMPMASHWRPWLGGGELRTLFGRLMLPGWPSAALFAAVGLGLIALMALVVPNWRPAGASAAGFAWWMMLAWQALVFPAVVLSFLPPGSSMRAGGTGYFVVQGLFGTISLLAATNSTGYITGAHLAQTLDAICQILPVFSFWLVEKELRTGFSLGNMIGQLASFAVVLALVVRQSRNYWDTVARFDRRAAAPPDVSP
jgi:hypothetical protein